VRRLWPLAIAVLGGCAAIRSIFPEPYPYQVTPGAVRVPGPAARAVGVAFQDFMAQLAGQRAEALQADSDGGTEIDGGAGPSAPGDCMDSPGFYDTWYSTDDAGTRFVIEIFPKPEVCGGPGAVLYGGGALYEIDAKTFTILKRELGE
jgi:hypothetical protein